MSFNLQLKPDAHTETYCVLGNPIAHSMSPVMHNNMFTEMNINAVYVAFCVDNIERAVMSIRELGIKGASVTIPFKKEVIEFLDDIDDLAKEIGAVNTIINKNGKLYGLNTDCAGAVNPLKKISELKDRNVFIFGAGGAARAIAFGIKNEQGKIHIINRTASKGRSLAQHVHGHFIPLSEINLEKADIIINTTSLGMFPDVAGTPVKPEQLKNHMTVMDIVYNPLKTRLLKDAEKAGCKIVDGLSMFVEQGACQFKLFTGQSPSRELMKKSVLKAMG